MVEAEEQQDKSEWFETIIALTIAIVSLIAAFIGGWSALTESAASGAQISGVIATVNREKAKVTSHTWMFQDLRAYAEHQRLSTLAEITTADAVAAQEQGALEQAQSLRQQALAYRTGASAAGTFFAGEYVNPDGSFDEETYLEHQMRFEVRNRDVDPDDDYDEAVALFEEAFTLVIVIRGLAIAITLLILAHITKSKLRYSWFAGGLAVFAGFMAYMAYSLNWIG